MSVFVAGHSLGAARAAEYAFSRLRRGLAVDGLYLFGCPNPGDRRLASGLAPIPVARSIKNRRDLITDVPVDLVWAGEEYVQPYPFEETDERSPAGDDWGPFADHHFYLYEAGVRKLPQPSVAVPLPVAATLVQFLYDSTEGWDWLHPVDGQYWGMMRVGEHDLLVARGTTTVHEWLQDFDAGQIDVCGARVSRGFWAGIGPIESELDAAVSRA